MDSVSSDASVKASGNTAALLPQIGAPDDATQDNAFAGLLSTTDVAPAPLQHNNMLPVISLQKLPSSHEQNSAASSSSRQTRDSGNAGAPYDANATGARDKAAALTWKKIKSAKLQDAPPRHDAKSKSDKDVSPAVAAAAPAQPAPPPVATPANVAPAASDPQSAPAADVAVDAAADVAAAVANTPASPPVVANPSPAPAASDSTDSSDDENAQPVAQIPVTQAPATPVVSAANAALVAPQVSAPTPVASTADSANAVAAVDPNVIAAAAPAPAQPAPQPAPQAAATPPSPSPASAPATDNAPVVQAVPADVPTVPVASDDVVSAAVAAPAAKDGKTDFKSLTALFAKTFVQNAVAKNANAVTDNAVAADDADVPAASMSAANSSTPSALTAKAAPSDTTKNNWVDSFLNLFSTPATPNPAGPAFLPGAVTANLVPGAPSAADDLMSDSGQEQNATPRDAAAGALSNNASMPVVAQGAHAASPYTFASQLSALRATQGGMTGLPSAIDQVVLQMGKLAKDGSGDMTIQLRPAELGRIDVKLSVDGNGKVQGTVTADNPATLHLLSKDVGSLERALQEAGLRADSGSLQFSLRGDSQQGSAFAGNDANARGGDSNSANTVAVPTADETEIYYLTPGRVNIRV